MPRIQVIEEENAKGKVKAVYDELRSVFGKVPGVMKALSPWPDMGLISPDTIAADYQTAAILDADKKVLAYVEKVRCDAYKTIDTDVDGLKGCGWSEGQVLEEQL